jgi:hypothetical protein
VATRRQDDPQEQNVVVDAWAAAVETRGGGQAQRMRKSPYESKQEPATKPAVATGAAASMLRADADRRKNDARAQDNGSSG